MIDIEILDARLKRLEELHPPKKTKSKRAPKWLHIDPKAVRASMTEKGWNQSDLARQLKVGKDRVSVWLSGKECPSPEHWDLLRRFVDIV